MNLFWFSQNSLIDSKKSGKVKAAYKREYVNLGCDVDFDFAGPTIHGNGVVGYEGWLAGYQMSFDTAKSKMIRNNFAIGYKTGDFQLHTNVWVDMWNVFKNIYTFAVGNNRIEVFGFGNGSSALGGVPIGSRDRKSGPFT